MASDLERAFNALNGKQASYNQLFQYYDGDQPTVYTTSRLKEIFAGLDAVFVENWCAVVVDSVRDRINLSAIQAPPEAEAIWKRLWETSQIKLESDDVHESALIAGESFIIAWPDDSGMAQAYYNDPRLVQIFYEPSNPRVKQFAAKWWKEGDEETRLTLYYQDRLEYYAAKGKETPASAKAFRSMQENERNPYGEIPVFHFRTTGRGTRSDLKNVTPIQNGINKLLADMMVAAEYGAFNQRYVISNAETQGKLKNAPGIIWDIPAGDGMGQQTTVGQFTATPLENYLKAVNDLSMAISSITRTPKHYFFSIGSNLSGEALIAMEGPLNKKAQDRIDRFIPTWQDMTRFMLKVSGIEVLASEITPVYDDPESVQPFTEAQAIQMMVSSGIPLTSACRRMGWSKTEVQELEADIEAQAASQQMSLANGLIEAQRRFDQG